MSSVDTSTCIVLLEFTAKFTDKKNYLHFLQSSPSRLPVFIYAELTPSQAVHPGRALMSQSPCTQGQQSEFGLQLDNLSWSIPAATQSLDSLVEIQRNASSEYL